VNVQGFQKCCLTSALVETDDNLWDDGKEDWNVRSKCEDGDDTDC
jgi:hypothetical protein